LRGGWAKDGQRGWIEVVAVKQEAEPELRLRDKVD